MKLAIRLMVALLSTCATVLANAAPPLCTTGARCVITLHGIVSSGAGTRATAIAGAKITIFQAQNTSPRVLDVETSDSDGQFVVSFPADGQSDIRYAVARSGDNVELAAVIGVATPAAITINEMTTVAAGYAMSQFFENGEIVGKSLPLQVAAAMAENLVSVQTGTPSLIMQTSPNADETNAWRSLGTLSNILAACIRNPHAACAPLFALTAAANGPKPTTTLQAVLGIARRPTTNVKELFALADMQRVFEPYLLPLHGPDSSDELLRLDGFTLAVKVNATGRIDRNGDEVCPFGGPGNLAFDANGYAWITNNVIQGTPNSAHCMVVLKPNGEPADGAGGTPDSPVLGGGIVGQGFGIGIDPSGDIWAGNFGWGDDVPNGSVSKFTPNGHPISPTKGYADGLSRVQGTTSDQAGNIWMASSANNSVHVFPNGKPNAGASFADSNRAPFHIVIDDGGFGWVSYTESSAVSKFEWSQARLTREFSVPLGNDVRPKGMALDTGGNVWVAAGAASLVYGIDKAGRVIGGFSGGGILGPWGVTVDSKDNVWIANFGPEEQITTKYRLSRMCGITVSNCPPGISVGDPISPATGYTLPSAGAPVRLANGQLLYEPLAPPSFKPLMRATAAHVDMAGNVWITNNWKPSGLNDVALNPGGDGIVIFVGLAAPVKPTIAGHPTAP